jgi:hypothetical protein
MTQYNFVPQNYVHQLGNLCDLILSQLRFLPVLLENLQVDSLKYRNTSTEFASTKLKNPFHRIFVRNYFSHKFLIELILVLIFCFETIRHRFLKFGAENFVYFGLVFIDKIRHLKGFELFYHDLERMLDLDFLKFYRVALTLCKLYLGVFFMITIFILFKNQLDRFFGICPSKKICVESLANEWQEFTRLIRN